MEQKADYLTVIEVAEMLNLTPNAVRARIRGGSLPGIKSNKGWLIAAADVMQAQGVSKSLAQYLCQMLANNLAQNLTDNIRDVVSEIGEDLLRRGVEKTTRDMASAREALGYERAKREAAEAEAQRLKRDLAALSMELREYGVRRTDQTQEA